MRSLLLLFFAFLLFAACATVRTEQNSDAQAHSTLQYPPAPANPWRAQVVRIAIPSEWATAYPELLQKNVGLGLYQRVLSELSRSRHFTLNTADSSSQTLLLQQWAFAQSGLVAELPVSEGPQFSAPDYLIYAEIFDFAISRTEQVRGVHSQEESITRVGVQLRFVHAQSGELIPISGSGEARTQGEAWFTASAPRFEQTTVGIATERALQQAILKAIHHLTPRSNP
jgi:hypothetical protein